MYMPPSLPARAAAVLHHTWGIETPRAAADLFLRIMECETLDQLDALLESMGSGVWAQVANLPLSDLQENIHCLAASIDACTEDPSLV